MQALKWIQATNHRIVSIFENAILIQQLDCGGIAFASLLEVLQSLALFYLDENI